jgi:hypothetical protein
LLLAFSGESFNRDSKRSACRATDTRSSPDIPAKIGIRRLSEMSCESRLTSAAFGRNQTKIITPRMAERSHG